MSLTESSPIRVLVVDDHEQVRRSVAAVLEAAGDILVCGQASAVSEAERAAAVTEPDVAVIDLRLGRESGIQAGRDIRGRRPETHVILLTSASDEEAMFAAVLAGADGYLTKQLGITDLVGAVRNAARSTGTPEALTPEAAARLRHMVILGATGGAAATDQDEQQLLDLVIAGRTDGEIAEALSVGNAVVRERVAALLAHLDAGRRSASVLVPRRAPNVPVD